MSNLITIKNVSPFVRSRQPSKSLWLHLPNARVMFAIFILSLVTEVILFLIVLTAFKTTDIWTRFQKWSDDTDLQTEALFEKYFNVNVTIRNSVSLRNSMYHTKALLAANGVLLKPPLIGRLGNQMFSWAATWGMVQRLRTKLNHSRPVELVIKSSQELFRFITFLL